MAGEEFFDGSRKESFGGDVADIPMGNSPYTIELFVKPESNVGHGVMVGWGECEEDKANYFRFMDHSRLRNNWWGGNDLDATTSASIADGHYHHVAVTFDGTTRSIFLDYALLVSDTPGVHIVDRKDNFLIGGKDCSDSRNWNFKGYMRDVKIFAHARSVNEMER